MGEQRKKAFGTLLAAAVVKGITEAMEHTARDKCVDLRADTAELIVYLTNKKKITIPLN